LGDALRPLPRIRWRERYTGKSQPGQPARRLPSQSHIRIPKRRTQEFNHAQDVIPPLRWRDSGDRELLFKTI